MRKLNLNRIIKYERLKFNIMQLFKKSCEFFILNFNPPYIVLWSRFSFLIKMFFSQKLKLVTVHSSLMNKKKLVKKRDQILLKMIS